MTNEEKAQRWDELMDDMEVMEEFDDVVWIKVDKGIIYGGDEK